MDFQPKIQEIERLIHQEKFSEALEQLEVIVNLPNFELSAEQKGETNYQASFCLYMLGRYREALDKALSIYKVYKDSSENRRVAQIQNLLARIYFELDDLRNAEQQASDAIGTYRRIEDRPELLKSFNFISQISFMNGDYGRSMDYLNKASEIAKDTQNTRMVAIIQGNIGRVQTLLGNWDEAEENLKVSLSYNQNNGNEQSCCSDLLSLGFLLSLGRNFNKSEELIKKAYDIASSNHLSRELGIYYEYAGHLACCKGDWKEANAHFLKATNPTTTHQPHKSLIAQTYRLWAELLVDQNQLDKALTYCYESLQASKSLGEKVEEAVVYRILGQIFSIKGNQEESRKNFENALSLLQQLSVKYELAKANLEAGKSQVFDYHERMGYLYNAERLFKELDLRFWLGSVNLAVADLLFEQWQYDGAQVFLTEAEKSFKELDDRKQMRKVSDLRHAIEEAAFQCWKISKSNGKPTLDNFETKNVEMKALIEKLKQIKDYDVNILLEGETGVGKDLIAKAIHYSSSRKNQKFVSLSCGDRASALIENDLFGHRQGSYTDASRDQLGFFEEAEGGTLYLDQIEDIPLSTQVKLLRAIENKEIIRIGETKPRKVDVRIICSSIKNLKEMVKNGTFREDLYFRINTFELEIPPLRDRKEDIPILINHFLKLYGVRESAIKEFTSNGNMDKFLSYKWDGNIRELDNYIKKMAILSEATRKALWEFLPDGLKQSSEEAAHEKNQVLSERVDNFAREEIIRTLNETGWNKSAAARQLGMPEGTLRSKMKKLKIYPLKLVS